MSGSAIADAIVTNLSATSVLGAGMVSKSSYRVLEVASGSCAVISLAEMRSEPVTFGAPRGFDRLWNVEITFFTKDTGDPDTVLNRIYSGMDGMVASLESDDTLQGVSDGIIRLEGAYRAGQAVEAGGFAWLPITLRVLVREIS